MTHYISNTVLTCCIVLGLVLIASGCEKDPINVPKDTDSIVTAIDSANWQSYWEGLRLSAAEFDSIACGVLTIPSDPPQINPPSIIGSPTITNQDGIICTGTDYEWALGVDNAFLYDPTSDVFFLGVPIDGTSIQSGAYRLFTNDLAPITGSISLENIGGSPSFYVENPTLSNYRAAIVNMQNQLDPAGTPAKIDMVIEDIYSAEQAIVAARVSFGGFGLKLNASYDWSNEEVETRLLVNFTQIYYTLDLDITRSKPSEFFDIEDMPDMAALNGGMPVYVSSIKYGRQVVLAIESSYSSNEVRAALSASYNGLLAGGGINMEAEHQEVLESSKISAFVVGGSGEVVAENVASASTFANLITIGGRYSPDSPGAPLSYTLRYLCDNSIAKIALASEYSVRECEEVGIPMVHQPGNNNNLGYYYCAQKFEGEIPLISAEDPNVMVTADGDDFSGNGPVVDGQIKLELRSGNKEVWCVVNVIWQEATANYTTGIVDKSFHLFSAPEGKVISGLVGNDSAYFQYTDEDDHHGPDFPETTGADFVSYLKIIGDTSGDDLGCSGDDDANIRFKLGPIHYTLLNE
ncbi:MAG: thiol-activated cytolysin family protein [Cyanobacteria bacterium J06600_6]